MQLLAFLENKKLMLILDNYEHLLEGALICSELVQHCPQIQLLVTSRERLHTKVEWAYPLNGLGRVDSQDTPETINEGADEKQNDAQALFFTRAK